MPGFYDSEYINAKDYKKEEVQVQGVMKGEDTMYNNTGYNTGYNNGYNKTTYNNGYNNSYNKGSNNYNNSTYNNNYKSNYKPNTGYNNYNSYNKTEKLIPRKRPNGPEILQGCLYPEDIEPKAITTSKDGAVKVYLFKSRTADKKVLLDKVGRKNFSIDYEVFPGTVKCTLRVKYQDTVYKSEGLGRCYGDRVDYGYLYEDSLKSAGRGLGIGEELYTKKDIWLPASFTGVSLPPVKPGEEIQDKKVNIYNVAVYDIKYNNEKELEEIIFYNTKTNKTYTVKNLNIK